MSRKILFDEAERSETVFGELLIGDYFLFHGSDIHYRRDDFGYATRDVGTGRATQVSVDLSSAVIKIGFAEEAEPPKLIPTTYVATAEVVDPRTKNTVQVEIRQMESGPMVGLDAAYLENLASDPAQDYPVCPYNGEPLWVANDEGPGAHAAVLIGRHRMPGTTHVEFLLAYEDQTWNTCEVDVPFTTTDDYQFVLWAQEELLGTANFRKVVQVALYCISDPEEEDVDDAIPASGRA